MLRLFWYLFGRCSSQTDSICLSLPVLSFSVLASTMRAQRINMKSTQCKRSFVSIILETRLHRTSPLVHPTNTVGFWRPDLICDLCGLSIADNSKIENGWSLLHQCKTRIYTFKGTIYKSAGELIVITVYQKKPNNCKLMRTVEKMSLVPWGSVCSGATIASRNSGIFWMGHAKSCINSLYCYII